MSSTISHGQVVNPEYLKSFIAGRLVPLAKKPTGVRPIGIGEVLRRVVKKTKCKKTKCNFYWNFIQS